jgi:LysR family transcriptional regulator, glycine cleavage system transcriptional activator
MAMVAGAAMAGLGVGLLARCLVEVELQAGRLVVPYPHSVWSRETYFLAYPKDRQDLPALRVFKNWLMSQMPNDTDQRSEALMYLADRGRDDPRSQAAM